ncbi:hypothetical protein ACHWQZ_G010451 [Mnemiopsis leidyi]
MISVTQPRRPADDFLASLQTNLQGNARSRRRRGQQQPNTAAANVSSQKNIVAPKAQSRVRPAQQKTKQNRIKSEPVVNDKHSATKKPKQAVKSNSPKLQQSHISSQSEDPTPHATSNVHIEIIPSVAPEVVQQPPLSVETVQNVQDVTVPDYSVPVLTENMIAQQQLHNVRASQNNFYMKNQSNIFNTGFSPYQAHPSHATNRTSIADNVVVENALRIAAQQPLPAPPSFSTPRGYFHHDQNSNQPPQNQGIPTQQRTHGTTGQSQVTQEQPYFGQPNRGVDQNPVLPPDTKPLNSHYSQSFSIGGGAPLDTKTAQELERRKWIQELEAQVREKKERDQREKMRQKSPYPAPVTTSLHAPVTHQLPSSSNIAASANLYQSNLPPNLVQQPSSLQNNPPQQPTYNLPQQPTISSNSLQPSSQLQPPQILHLSPKTPVPQPTGSPTQGRMLGQGTWVDPVELERRQEARKRALENQEMIRRQVEERERLKKEERERIKREEEIEMRRIEEEKRKMAEEVRLEQEKRKQKEEAQLQQIADMRRKIEEANRSAKEEKRNKRSRSVSGKESTFKHDVESIPLESVEEIKTNHQRLVPVIEKTTSVEETHVQSAQTFAAPVPVQETVFVPVQHQPVQVQQPVPVQQPVRYVSNASTQTVQEVSCQTMTREESFLPADSRLIQLKERELSVVQRKQDSAKRGTSKRNDNDKQGSAKRNVPNRNNTDSRRGPIKPQPGSKLPVKKQQERKVPEVPRVQYDKNGRRIRRTKPPSPQDETPPAANIIAEESEVITEYETIADIFDNPESPVMKVESVGPSPFTVPEQQVQMRYTSPKNETRTIPSAISVRQNDILSQLEKLRMGLKDRRRHVSSTEIIQ